MDLTKTKSETSVGIRYQ